MTLTSQCEEFVPYEHGRFILMLVQSILAPIAEELFHVHGGSVVLIFRYV